MTIAASVNADIRNDTATKVDITVPETRARTYTTKNTASRLLNLRWVFTMSKLWREMYPTKPTAATAYIAKAISIPTRTGTYGSMPLLHPSMTPIINSSQPIIATNPNAEFIQPSVRSQKDAGAMADTMSSQNAR